ncbi:MAG: ester cyclase [Bacteroidales bacterium]|nr:ester cyclase [Bacteroidales bacterium]
MKRLSLVIIMAVTIMSCSAQNEEFNNLKNQVEMEKTQLEKNKEIALNLSKAIMNGEWNKVDELIAEDFTYEADGRPAIGKQEYIGFMKNVLSNAFSDMDMKFLRVIAEENLVAIDYTNEMTNTGDFMGMPATNKRVLATGQFIREIKDGKITAEWQTTNSAGLIQQLTAK